MVQLLPQTYIVTKQMLNTEIKDTSFKTSGMGGGSLLFTVENQGKNALNWKTQEATHVLYL